MAKKQVAGTTAPQSVTEACARIAAWIKQHHPRWKPLKKGATAASIAKAERALGGPLPDQLKELLLAHNGTGEEGFFCTSEGGSFYLLSVADLVRTWQTNGQLLACGDFAGQAAQPDKGVRGDWWHEGWIPFASNGGGDEWCVDLAPGKGGGVGQIVVFVSDHPRRQRVAKSLLDWLAQFTTDLEAGKLVYDPDEGGLTAQ